jgi:hypothetical protein
MPEQEIAKRGGATKYRMICPHGKARGHCSGPYINVAVVRKRGKRGGRTVAGPVHHKGA